MTTYTQAIDAIITKLQTVWTDPIAFNNRPFTIPSTSTAWCRVTISHDKGDVVSLAAFNNRRRWGRQGYFTIQVFFPLGIGINYAILEQIVEQYESGVSDQDIRFSNMRIKDIGEEVGGWYQTNIIVDFFFDEVR